LNIKESKIESRELKMNTTTIKSVLAQISTVRAKRPVLSASTKALSTWLSTAGVAALLVLANHLMDDWAETHLMAAWLALWALAIVAIVVLRGLSRMLAQNMITGLNQWSAHLARSRADQRLWSMAQTDSRLMGELQTAMDRADENAAPTPNLTTYMTRRAARMVKNRLYYI
jgi:hypothetical protein